MSEFIDQVREYQEASSNHSEIFKKFGWPSSELTDANERCSKATFALKAFLGLSWNQPVPSKYERNQNGLDGI